MSKNKSSKRRRKQRDGVRKRSDATTNQQAKPDSNTSAAEKKHVGPITTLLIVIPFIAIVIYFAWSVLGSNNDEQITENGIPNNTLANDATSPEKYPWNRPGVSNKVWVSDEHRKEAWNQIDNPSRDGWDTEVFANRVGQQFGKLKELLTSDRSIDANAIKPWIANDVSVRPLRPPQLQTTFHDDSLQIQRGLIAESEPPESVDQNSATGATAFAAALQQMIAPYEDREKLRIKIKVLRVEKDEEFVTHQSVEIFGPTKKGLMEENAIWITRWQHDDNTPLIIDIGVVEYEAVQRYGKTLFSDCTESVLGKNASFQNQLLQGFDQWLDRSQFVRFYSNLGNPGVAIGDVNSDGLDDVYVCQEAGLPNLLYFQNPDGTLRDVSKQSGTDWLQASSAALIVDIDNDGINDLAVGMVGGVVLAKGDGAGRFTVQTVLDSSDHVMVLTAVDYDRDSRLDLYVGAYFPDDIGGETQAIALQSRSSGDSAFGYLAHNGAKNILFRNESKDGHWSFHDVTEAVGLDQNNRRFSFAASWEDYDNDGDQDLYVANDYGLNVLYRNDTEPDGTGSFVDVSKEANAEDNAFGMSVAWGDYDRDGWMDLYISNMFSYAGHRIAFQDKFQANANDEVREGYQRFARGNTLLRNLGKSETSAPPKFQDQSLAERVNRGRWAWGSRFVDVNNDGWEDLVVANGYITASESGDL